MRLKKNGYATLTAVLLIAMVLLMAGLSVSSRVRSRIPETTHLADYAQAYATGLSCLEEGEIQLSRNIYWLGTQLNIAGSSCTITVVQRSATVYAITAESTADTSHRTFVLVLEAINGDFRPIERFETL